MTPIASPHNPKLKELRKLARTRERARSGLFAAEGEDLVRAADAAGARPVYGFKAVGASVGAPRFEAVAEEIDPGLLASASALGSGTRAIGVYEQRFGEACGPLCVYLHGVGDPGNVGAVLRSALAFGACTVALGPGCADPHSPKAVRASMGAIFGVAVARVGNVDELPGERVALVAGAGDPLWEVCEALRGAGVDMSFSGGLARARGLSYIDSSLSSRARARGTAETNTPHPGVTLLVGAERDGLPDELVSGCEHVAHIPIASESLNAAMAATVALYEMRRPSNRVPGR